MLLPNFSFLTDSTKHFLVGSLYFYSRPNYDSLLPALDYIEKDVVHLMETLSWKPKKIASPLQGCNPSTENGSTLYYFP